MDIKRKLSIIIIVLGIVFIFSLDVFDLFSHGYYTESVSMSDIYEGDLQGVVNLSEEDSVKVQFTPIKKHFAGFVIYLTEQSENNSGNIVLKTSDESGKIIEQISVDISQIENEYEYKIRTKKHYKKDHTYFLEIKSQECKNVPKMLLIDSRYLTEESIENNLLLGYAYEESTFTNTEKVLITIFLISILLILISYLHRDVCMYVCMGRIGVFIFLATIMSWNFNFNSLDNNNLLFEDFQSSSEGLVVGSIAAEQDEMWEYLKTGLADYINITGDYYTLSDHTFLTNENWNNGYHRSENKILLSDSDYTKSFLYPENYIKFSNGQICKIIDVTEEGIYFIVTLESERPLNQWVYGDLSEAVFLNQYKNEVVRATGKNYQSQYGLQGKIYRHLARWFELDMLKLLTAIGTAYTLLLIVYLIAVKYDKFMASVFYVVFLLSPWIVNFSNNMYWVEFTWFLPMAVGLLCAWKVKDKKIRIFSYVLAFLFIMIKCLCGYEYISVVMMGLIQFLLVDLILAVVSKNKEHIRLLFRTIFILGICALIGFGAAICIHAPVKSGGDILAGIKLIIENDVLRRTYGMDLNKVIDNNIERMAIYSSSWEVLCKYFKFDTEIITGVAGNLFPLLCIAPLIIFLLEKKNNKLNLELFAMYCISFITTITWFILAKSHSYVHTHMNFVLWYFGFVQICIFIILKKLSNYFNKDKSAF